MGGSPRLLVLLLGSLRLAAAPIDVGGEGFISGKFAGGFVVFDDGKCLNDYVKAMNSDSAVEQRGIIAKLHEIGCASRPPQSYHVIVTAVISKTIDGSAQRFCMVSGALDHLLTFHSGVGFDNVPPLLRGIVPCGAILTVDRETMEAIGKKAYDDAMKKEDLEEKKLGITN